MGGARRETLKLGVQLRVGDVLLADDTYTVIAGEVRRIALSDPGIDDYRNSLLWNPATPTLIEVRLQLWADRGHLGDEVMSYTALRSVNVDSDRVVLNGRTERILDRPEPAGLVVEVCDVLVRKAHEPYCGR